MMPLPRPSAPHDACPHCCRVNDCPAPDACALCRCHYCEQKRRAQDVDEQVANDRAAYRSTQKP